MYRAHPYNFLSSILISFVGIFSQMFFFSKCVSIVNCPTWGVQGGLQYLMLLASLLPCEVGMQLKQTYSLSQVLSDVCSSVVWSSHLISVVVWDG